MAKLVFGNVYYQDIFAGILQREPGGRHVFNYDPSYLDSQNPAIALSLEAAQAAIIDCRTVDSFMKNKLIKMMEGRWKHSFASIGQYLSKKRNNGENR